MRRSWRSPRTPGERFGPPPRPSRRRSRYRPRACHGAAPRRFRRGRRRAGAAPSPGPGPAARPGCARRRRPRAGRCARRAARPLPGTDSDSACRGPPARPWGRSRPGGDPPSRGSRGSSRPRAPRTAAGRYRVRGRPCGRRVIRRPSRSRDCRSRRRGACADPARRADPAARRGRGRRTCRPSRRGSRASFRCPRRAGTSTRRERRARRCRHARW